MITVFAAEYDKEMMENPTDDLLDNSKVYGGLINN